ncbi:MAG: acyl dehydratase [Pseudomonadota bacterium]
MTSYTIDGPYFEDFSVGQTFRAPSVTITEGHAALYQALFGDRMRLPLDHHLARRVTGLSRPIAHPNLTTNLAVGQTTYASQHVKGNLFYRGLALRKACCIGDTLTTTTVVVGLKQNRIKPGRAATGMVALKMTAVDQNDDVVFDFWRCPMIACRDAEADTGKNDDFSSIPEAIADEALLECVPPDWNLDAFVELSAADTPDLEVQVGDLINVGPRDTVTSAPELVRMTGNIAYTHTDATASYLGQRLVYGGHTIALAMAAIARALPNILTVVAWQSGDHIGPVAEDDVIRTQFEVKKEIAVPHGGRLLELDVTAFAIKAASPGEEQAVLKWRVVVWTL